MLYFSDYTRKMDLLSFNVREPNYRVMDKQNFAELFSNTSASIDILQRLPSTNAVRKRGSICNNFLTFIFPQYGNLFISL